MIELARYFLAFETDVSCLNFNAIIFWQERFELILIWNMVDLVPIWWVGHTQVSQVDVILLLEKLSERSFYRAGRGAMSWLWWRLWSDFVVTKSTGCNFRLFGVNELICFSNCGKLKFLEVFLKALVQRSEIRGWLCPSSLILLQLLLDVTDRCFLSLEFLREGLKLLATNRLASEHLLVVLLAHSTYHFGQFAVYGWSKDMLEIIWHVLIVLIFPLVWKYYICLNLKKVLTWNDMLSWFFNISLQGWLFLFFVAAWTTIVSTFC